MPDEKCLSIIIPFYNVGRFLEDCAGSLLASDGIEDTEIIFVDDGSTDMSADTAERYSREHDFIRVIRIENSGPSQARNTGLKEASGTYVFFCDSDDKVDPGLFMKIIAMCRTSDSDIILWDSGLIDENGNHITTKESGYFAHEGLEKTERVYTGKELIGTLLKNSGNFAATIWLGAYRKDFLISGDHFFEQGLIHEDELWVPKVLLSAGKISYIPEKVYLYRNRTGSITNPGTGDMSEHVASLMKIYPSLYDYYDETLAGDPLKEQIEENLTSRYLCLIFRDKFYRYGYGKMIDKKRLWKTSGRLKDKIKILILYVIAH